MLRATEWGVICQLGRSVRPAQARDERVCLYFNGSNKPFVATDGWVGRGVEWRFRVRTSIGKTGTSGNICAKTSVALEIAFSTRARSSTVSSSRASPPFKCSSPATCGPVSPPHTCAPGRIKRSALADQQARIVGSTPRSPALVDERHPARTEINVATQPMTADQIRHAHNVSIYQGQMFARTLYP
eukprot:1194758-Prorocentrum_minimum.AAC.10